MTTPSEEPLERANEADVVEQSQELDGAGSVSAGPDLSTDEADEADAIEQSQAADGAGSVSAGADVSTGEADEADAIEQGANISGDDDAYPHRAEESGE